MKYRIIERWDIGQKSELILAFDASDLDNIGSYRNLQAVVPVGCILRGRQVLERVSGKYYTVEHERIA